MNRAQPQLPLALDLFPSDQTNHGETISSGFQPLDQRLPTGGWPLGAITEIFYPSDCSAALKLVLPALAKLSHTERWLAWIAPPKAAGSINLQTHGINTSRILKIHPHPTTDGLWAVEKALRSPTCGAVLSWVAGADQSALARLQKAAEEGNTCGFIFRPDWAYEESSPAALRLKLERGKNNNEMLVRTL